MHPSLKRDKCCECGQALERENMIQLHSVSVCFRCKPILLQRMAEGVTDRPAIQARRPMAIWAALSALLLEVGISLVRRAMRSNWNNPLVYVQVATEIIMLSVPIIFIYLGRSWARWLLAAYAFGGICLSVPKLLQYRGDTSWLLGYGLSNAVVLAALIGLFLPSSTKWFRGEANAAHP